MIRSLSTAASGMEAEQTRLDVTANNIANVSTPGFKKSRVEFEDMLYSVTRAPGAPTGADSMSPTGEQIGMGVRTVGTDRVFSQGDMRQTSNPLDVAIEGPGFFPVNLPSGEVGYTRDGSFKLDVQGRMVDGSGHPLVSDVVIPPEAQSISIAPDGAVLVTVAGDATPSEVGRIELATFANPGGLMAAGHNLFRETIASGTAIASTPGQNGTGGLAQGSVELSNVKVVEEMIDLISGQRAYEINARVIRASDEMLQQISNLR